MNAETNWRPPGATLGGFRPTNGLWLMVPFGVLVFIILKVLSNYFYPVEQDRLLQLTLLLSLPGILITKWKFEIRVLENQLDAARVSQVILPLTGGRIIGKKNSVLLIGYNEEPYYSDQEALELMLRLRKDDNKKPIPVSTDQIRTDNDRITVYSTLIKLIKYRRALGREFRRTIGVTA